MNSRVLTGAHSNKRNDARPWGTLKVWLRGRGHGEQEEKVRQPQAGTLGKPLTFDQNH